MIKCLDCNDRLDKKFILAVLYDISFSPITLKIVKELPWNEGIGKIVKLAFNEEPIAVSFIVSNFNKDIVVRNQLITMMPQYLIAEVLVLFLIINFVECKRR